MATKNKLKLRKDFNPNDVTKYFRGILPPDLSKLRSSGEKFVDPYFPPDDTSILSKKPNGDFIDPEEGPANQEEMEDSFGYVEKKRAWARPETIMPGKWVIFKDGIDLDDVVQGNLGDCYFISAVAGLVEFPELLKQNFPEQKYEDLGYYEVVLYLDGEWQRVFLDNFFPIKSNYKKLKSYRENPTTAFFFSKPNGQELWSMLLEKAWAKVNGGYSNTSGGNQHEVLLAFTGFPSEIIFNSSDIAYDIFKKIESADKCDAVMGCGSYPGTDSNVNENNISYGHAYTLIGAKSKKEQLGTIDLYKIRNPWGEGEWTGKWNDNDKQWESEEIKNYFDFKGGEDGIFFMSADDYPDNFQNTQICRILYDAKMRNYFINKEEFFKGALVYNLFLPNDGEVIFSVVERNRRFNRDLPYEKYAFFSLLIFKYDKDYKITKFYGGKSNTTPLGIHEQLEKGYYACVIYFPYEYLELGENFNYTFTIYSSIEFKSKFSGKDPKLQCLEKLIIEYFKYIKAFEISSTQKYLSTDVKEIFNATNIIPRILYNKLNQKIQFKLNFDKAKNKGFATVGHFDEKYWNGEKEIVLDKNSFGIYLTARTNIQRTYKPESKISYGKAVEQKDAINFEDFKFNNHLFFDFEDDKDLATPKANPKDDATTITKDSALMKIELGPAGNPDNFSNRINTVCSYENLKKEYPSEFNVLEKYIKEKQEQSKYTWLKISNPAGTIICQVNNKRVIEGRGIFLYNNGTIYIGRFSKNNLNEFGLIFDKNRSLIYRGEITKGIVQGDGILYKGDNYWIGNFNKGKIEGFGIGNANGHEWVGNFTNNKENGVGFMKFMNPKKYSLYEYDKGKAVGQIDLNDKESNILKEKRDKVYTIMEQNAFGNSSKEEIDKSADEFLKELNEWYEYKKKYGADKTPKEQQ